MGVRRKTPLEHAPAGDQDSIGLFLHHLMAECGVSSHTLAAYRSDLIRFSRWRRDAARGRISALKIGDLVSYVEHLNQRGLAPRSVSRHIASLSSYFRFLVAEGAVKENLVQLLMSPAVWDRLPNVLAPEMVGRLLAAPSSETRLGKRDRAILEMLYATGCRASEVAGFRFIDLDWDSGTARCTGKGNKERIVPVGAKARDALRDYLEHARPSLVGGAAPIDVVFVTRRGRPISRVSLWRIVQKYARQVGVVGQVGPHSFRHSFATHMLAGGADLRVVQELLGHASIATTQIYTRVEMSRLLQVHRQYHPRGRGVRQRPSGPDR